MIRWVSRTLLDSAANPGFLNCKYAVLGALVVCGGLCVCAAGFHNEEEPDNVHRFSPEEKPLGALTCMVIQRQIVHLISLVIDIVLYWSVFLEQGQGVC